MNYVDNLLVNIAMRVQHSNELNNTVKVLNNISTAQRFVQRQMMITGFGMLFAGMALKRLGENIINSLVKTYMMATDEQSKFNQELMAVQASFEFLKFSIMDALGQSDMVIGFIDFFINLVNLISEFVNKHPLASKLIGLFAILAVVVGGLAMIIGQLSLASIGMALRLISGFFLIAGAIIALIVIWKSEWGTGTKILLTVITLLALVVGGLVLIGKGQLVVKKLGAAFLWLAKNPLAGGLIVALGLACLAIWNMADAMGGFGNFAKAVFAGVLKLAIVLSDGLKALIIDKLAAIMSVGGKIARFFGKTGLANLLEQKAIDLKLAATAGYEIMVAKMEAVDVGLGMDKIRAANPDVENLGKVLAGMTTFDATTFEYMSASATKQVELANQQCIALDKLGGGSSLKSIENKLAEANALKSATEKEVKGQTNNIDITVNDLTGGNQGLADFIKRTVLDTLDEDNRRRNGVTQGA